MQCGTPLAIACASCGAELLAGARFCVSCGNPVAVPGAGDGDAEPVATPAPRSYTPRHLAEKILKTRGAIEGERKQVTVLFADIKESMNLAEQIDAEAWHGILDGFFSILSAGVHRFEGTINQYTGDGVMALFGAPIAHEDHAHRACFAALHLSDELSRYADELRRTHGMNFSARMGINSGEVVVGRIGDDLRMDYTAQGHTVGLAARVEQLAAPNSAYLTANTATLVDGYFRMRDLGEFAIKGVREPLHVHQLEGVGEARTRLDVSRSRGFSRFVGRESEMATLDKALADVEAGESRVVGVIAEAGAGKSRLCYEFIERCKARNIPIFEAHCVSHGEMMPFLPILELLRNYFGVTDQDSDQTARDKIAGRLLLLDEGLKPTLPHIFDFLGVADGNARGPQLEPHERQKLLSHGLRKIMESGAEQSSTTSVILFEDLHWIDGGSDAFLADMVSMIENTCELVVVNSRPGYTAEWMKLPTYTQIDLEPLDQEAISALLRDLLGADPTVRGLADRIGEETGGNPFFVEEMVRALLESEMLQGTRGAYRLANPYEKIVIPQSVHGVLAARIDRLDERHKAVLETAAVVGKSFSERLLRDATEEDDETFAEALAVLTDGEFIEQTQAYPEVEYAFHHPITQEVSYGTQLADRRVATHRRVAMAVENDSCNKCDSNAAVLAHHWEGAGELLPAVKWSKRAAEWAATRDLGEAQRHWRKVCELLEKCDECTESVPVAIAAREALIEVGWKLGAPLAEAANLFEEGKGIAERSGDRAGLARLTAAFAMARLFTGEVEQGLEGLNDATEIADTTDDTELKTLLQGRLAYLHLLAGHLEKSVCHVDTAIALVRSGAAKGLGQFPDPESYVRWLEGVRTLPQTYMGDLDGASRELERIIPAVSEEANAANRATAKGFLVTVAWFKGDTEAALANSREQLQLAEKLQTPALISGAYDSVCVAYTMAGRYDEAVQAGERALSSARESGTLLQSESVFVANVAAAYDGGGHADLALSTAREAVEIARRRSTPMFECRALLVLARVLLAAGPASIDEASEALTSALEIVERTGARGYEPFLRVELARLAELRGDTADGAKQLADAQRLFRENGATDHAERIGNGAAASP